MAGWLSRPFRGGGPSFRLWTALNLPYPFVRDGILIDHWLKSEPAQCDQGFQIRLSPVCDDFSTVTASPVVAVNCFVSSDPGEPLEFEFLIQSRDELNISLRGYNVTHCCAPHRLNRYFTLQSASYFFLVTLSLIGSETISRSPSFSTTAQISEPSF